MNNNGSNSFAKVPAAKVLAAAIAEIKADEEKLAALIKEDQDAQTAFEQRVRDSWMPPWLFGFWHGTSRYSTCWGLEGKMYRRKAWIEQSKQIKRLAVNAGDGFVQLSAADAKHIGLPLDQGTDQS